MRFIAYLSNGKVMEGKALGTGDTGWRDLPDVPIERLSYVNPYGDTLTLQGYEEYNHMVECVMSVGGVPTIYEVYLMGAKGGKVVVYRMAVTRRNELALNRSGSGLVQPGDVVVRVVDRGKEYLGTETRGWRKGIVNSGVRLRRMQPGLPVGRQGAG
jgi:hypothetical protein